MNCDFCGQHILATMQIAWHGGNFHPECIGEAVTQHRAAENREESEIKEALYNFDDEDFDEQFNAEFEEDFDDLELDEIIEPSPAIVPEIVGSNGGNGISYVEIPPSGVIVAPRAIIYPPANGNGKSSGSLIAGSKGSKFVSYEDLRGLPVPEVTNTFKPIPFYDFVTKLLDGLWDRRMTVHKDEYVISQDGMKLFGLIELVNEYNGVRFAIGLRSSNDKSMKLALAVGYRVMCCSNGMLSGDYLPLSVKHTAKLELDDSLALGIDRIRRKFTGMQTAINERQQRELTDGAATGIIYKAFTDSKFPVSLFRTVHKEYFVEPSYDEFKPRTLFSLENAFTTSFKKLQPIQQIEQTARLGKFLTENN